MGEKKVMLPADQVDWSSVKYLQEVAQGFGYHFRKCDRDTTIALKTFAPSKCCGILLYQNRPCLNPNFLPKKLNMVLSLWMKMVNSKTGLKQPLSVFHIMLTTPSMVAEHIISLIEEFNYHKPPTPLLVSFDPEAIRKQAAAFTRRFEEGNPLSILDGIFMAMKDDIDCYPHPSKGKHMTHIHHVRAVKKDAFSVSRLRSCGEVFIGKANMHELGMGTTGNNPHYGTTRNPHAPERYTGGSSSGPAAIIASGLCSAALGTDGGGFIHIPSFLYGQTDMEGPLCDSGTVEIIGPIASSVEDVMLASKFHSVMLEFHFLYLSMYAVGFQDYIAAQCLRQRLTHYHMEIFKSVDVIVTPTTGMTAPKIPLSALQLGETDMQVTGYLMLFIVAAYLLGLPAIFFFFLNKGNYRIGYDKQGLPVGLQLIGRPWAEATILRLAHAVEELCDESKKKPVSFYNVLKTN
ncbi:hypothetical protein SLA2020_256050 [Shorea laevis]